MIRKGRDTRGAEVMTAKLDAGSVSDMRAEYASGATQVDLSRKHGVTQAHVSKIVRGLAWKRPGRGGRWFAPMEAP